MLIGTVPHRSARLSLPATLPRLHIREPQRVRSPCRASMPGRKVIPVPLDTSLDRPMYLQLADELREEIRSGQRPPGSQLPTESEFYRRHGVSRTTVKATLRQLVSEGRVGTR